ncbi:Alpha/Beta hydrolase protein [Thamnocephalis sphaerospora]|uniref:Alpha/Beta hydrolase protein n=1 Tax=Thamnocephalis sphaerospora TaxID=78915 RepID=A0A4P9XI27_9FUNG|nr:Alpha/Beta hydrolase protein [Thamnocephalis sphaerospora]|eukprot:RKP04880.1 Alpha/Beta hydrolase protein [Thamnocephalis sphaerospora]
MDIEKALRLSLGLGDDKKPNGSTKTSSAVIASTPTSASVVQDAPHATSVLLQASKVKPPKGCLFLFPDGSGSASSYASIDKLDPSLAVYGLNCPWRTTPDDMAQAKVQMSQLVAKYIMELRNRQPRGPYNLGGWSAGGICAFEASRQLQEAGEVVQSLILIDSPNPIGLQNPPAR